MTGFTRSPDTADKFPIWRAYHTETVVEVRIGKREWVRRKRVKVDRTKGEETNKEHISLLFGQVRVNGGANASRQWWRDTGQLHIVTKCWRANWGSEAKCSLTGRQQGTETVHLLMFDSPVNESSVCAETMLSLWHVTWESKKARGKKALVSIFGLH